MTDLLNMKKDLNELLPSNVLSEIKLENEEENKDEEEEIVDVIFYYNYYNFIRILLINLIPMLRSIPVQILK